MARLTGVKVLDMTGGEVERISYEGAEYVRVEGDAKVGDIAVLFDGHSVIGGKLGEFYPVVEGKHDEPKIPTTYGGRINYVINDGYGAAFRKVSAQPTPTLAERFRKVDREPRAGDYVKFTFTIDTDITVGKYYEVTELSEFENPKFYDDGGVLNIGIPDEESFEIYEKVAEEAEEPKLKVGDYAKVVEHNNDIFFGGKPGDIVKIVKLTAIGYRVEELGGGNYNGNPNAKREALVPATGEEIAKAKRKAAHAKIFTDAGRKVDEYKAGDVVEVVDSPFAKPVGEVFEVRNYDGKYLDDGKYAYAPKRVKPVVFVENRLDLRSPNA